MNGTNSLSYEDMLFCGTTGDLFQEAVCRGYDLCDFVYKTINSEYGDWVYSIDARYRYTCGGYVFDMIQMDTGMKFLSPQRDYVIPPSEVGYFYRYWSLTRYITMREVLRLAPLNILDLDYFPRLHCNGYEFWIEELRQIQDGEFILREPDWSIAEYVG